MRRGFALLLLFSVLAASTAAQSLADVAREERERREKNRKEGVDVHEYAPEELFVEEGEEEPPAGEVSPEGLPGGGETENDARTGSEAGDRPVIPSRVDVSVDRTSRGGPSAGDGDPSGDGLERESEERRRRETEWRARFSRARDRVAAARERKQILEGLHLVGGERYVDAHGRTIVESLEHLRRLVNEAEEELRAAETSLADLHEEARREGVPPGWLR